MQKEKVGDSSIDKKDPTTIATQKHVIFCCENFFLSEIVKKWSIQHDGPITCLKLFALNTQVHMPSFVSQGESKMDVIDVRLDNIFGERLACI